MISEATRGANVLERTLLHRNMKHLSIEMVEDEDDHSKRKSFRQTGLSVHLQKEEKIKHGFTMDWGCSSH